MTNLILHGFYDDIGYEFVKKLEKTKTFKIVHWFGCGVSLHPRGFDVDIHDLHMGQIPGGPYEYYDVAWQEVEAHKEQIRKELIRCSMSDWKDELIHSFIYSYASYCVNLIRRNEVGLIIFGNVPMRDLILFFIALQLEWG